MSIIKPFLTNVREAVQYMRLMTPARLLNLIKLNVSYLLGRLFHQSWMWGLPDALSVEPATACNLRCPECPTGNGTLGRKGGTMSLSFYNRVLEQLPPSIFHLNLYLQGEPLLHPHIAEFVTRASQKHLFTTISTNAQLLSPAMAEQLVTSGLNKLIVSLDGLTPATYETYRAGGQLQKVFDGLENIYRAKKMHQTLHPIIEVQFIVFQHNEHEMPLVRKLINRKEIDRVQVKTAQLSFMPSSTIQPPVDSRLSRYAIFRGQWQMKHSLQNHCFKMWHSLCITWDGTVVPCCFDKAATHAMGNITMQPINNIWKMFSYGHFRKKIATEKHQIPMCHNCPEGRASLFNYQNI